MALTTIDEVKSAFERARAGSGFTKRASAILEDHVRFAKSRSSFDIFLSHAFQDQELVAGLKTLIEEQGLTVYVDWIDDPQLNRNTITLETAALLQGRMRSSKSLIFATSSASTNSKWMPWELGYFDGVGTGRIAIWPIVETHAREFKGQEYLGLYPVLGSFVDLAGNRELRIALKENRYLPLRKAAGLDLGSYR
jgi:hypothetical protein